MRTSVKWLKDYVDFSQSAEELADLLTMAGVPVAYLEYPGKDIEKVVTGRIIGLERHPNAEKLSVCKVNIGNQVLTIVTGATNVRPSQIVPVALNGAKLPNDKEIKNALFRGIESQGMLCSAEELNLDNKILPVEAREGIYILPSDTPIGVDIKVVLGLDDVVFEFELTANRADCFSVIGLAREVAALTGGTLKKPMLNLREEGGNKAGTLINIRIDEPSLCPRFMARVLHDVKIGPSPLWLQQRIQRAGMRPISNIVDVTNFVMLEMGQPMHAYDYNLLAKRTIIVRKAQRGEKLTTLDGFKRDLSPDMLVIADAVQPVGIAGVMGGLVTEVTSATQSVLLEAAAFNGTSIRRTSRALGLRSEASGRFERGVDTANIARALDRAAKLLEDMGACKVCPGVVDNYPVMALPKQINFTADAVNRYLGTDIAKMNMIDILRRLEFEVESHAEKVTVTVPTWRNDVAGMADISEEIARIYGFNNIPSTTPHGNIKGGTQSYLQTICDRIKEVLQAAGFNEIISFSFSHPEIFDKLNVPAESDLRNAIKVLNPITEDFPILRTNLAGGILTTVVNNLARKNDDIKIYELGAVYRPERLPVETLPAEPVMLCGAMMGRRNDISWNQTRDLVDFFDVKGVVEVLCERLGINNCQVMTGEHYLLHPGKTALFMKDGESLAVVGEVHPKILDSFEITRKVYMFELNIELVAKYAVLTGSYQPIPRYPAIARDLAVILPSDVLAAEVNKAIKDSGGPLLTNVRLFDVYTGDQVPHGMRSMAFSLLFRAPERTLTDEEIDKHYKAIMEHLEKAFKAKLRT